MKPLPEELAARVGRFNVLCTWWISYAVVPVLISVMAAVVGMHLLPSLRLLGTSVFGPAPVGFFLLSLASFVVLLVAGAIGTYQAVVSPKFPLKEISLGLAVIVVACLVAPALALPFTHDGLVEQESKGGTAKVETECRAMTADYAGLYADGLNAFGRSVNLFKDSLDPRGTFNPLLAGVIAVPIVLGGFPIGTCPAVYGGLLLPWLLLMSFGFLIVLPLTIRLVNRQFGAKSTFARAGIVLGILLGVWILWGILLAMGLDRALLIGSTAKAEARCDEHRTTRTQPYLGYDTFVAPRAIWDIAALVDETGIELQYFTVAGPTQSGSVYVYPTGIPRTSGTDATMLRAPFATSTTALYATDVRGVESVSSDAAAAIANDLDAGKAVVTGFKFFADKTDGSSATWSELYAFYAKYDRELHWFASIHNRTAPLTYMECYP
ncbi:hypothetical protein EBS80_01335 [bacterium]|nr:hypothetical protein [bacterium]